MERTRSSQAQHRDGCGISAAKIGRLWGGDTMKVANPSSRLVISEYLIALFKTTKSILESLSINDYVADFSAKNWG